jgi:hypothetical protein
VFLSPVRGADADFYFGYPNVKVEDAESQNDEKLLKMSNSTHPSRQPFAGVRRLPTYVS